MNLHISSVHGSAIQIPNTCLTLVVLKPIIWNYMLYQFFPLESISSKMFKNPHLWKPLILRKKRLKFQEKDPWNLRLQFQTLISNSWHVITELSCQIWLVISFISGLPYSYPAYHADYHSYPAYHASYLAYHVHICFTMYHILLMKH